MSGIALDTGALIALERNDRVVWPALKLAARNGDDVIVPSSALAQVWRGRTSQAHLSRALQYCVVASFDAVARAVGALCGRARTSDICDAHVAIVAGRQAEVLHTRDPKDLRLLLRALGGRVPAVVLC